MIVEILLATIYVMTLAIFARSIASFFIYDRTNPVMDFLITVTEPVLAPIRQVIPRMGMFDLSPMIAIFLLQLLVRPLVISIFG